MSDDKLRQLQSEYGAGSLRSHGAEAIREELRKIDISAKGTS